MNKIKLLKTWWHFCRRTEPKRVLRPHFFSTIFQVARAYSRYGGHGRDIMLTGHNIVRKDKF